MAAVIEEAEEVWLNQIAAKIESVYETSTAVENRHVVVFSGWRLSFYAIEATDDYGSGDVSMTRLYVLRNAHDETIGRWRSESEDLDVIIGRLQSALSLAPRK